MAPTGKHPDEIAAFRQDLRRTLIAARQALPAPDHAIKTESVLHHLSRLIVAVPPGTVGFCWPVQGEIDCRPYVDTLRRAGWKVALPVTPPQGQPLRFREWDLTSPLIADRHGIPHPEQGDWLMPDLLLIPLVGFDGQGFRLGYGGGFFDRTLEALQPRPCTIGIGFELGRQETLHPHPKDIPMDAVVTETGADIHRSSSRLRHKAHD